jgi:hypothetical protein
MKGSGKSKAATVYATRTYCTVEAQLHAFFTSAIDGDGQLHEPNVVIPGLQRWGYGVRMLSQLLLLRQDSQLTVCQTNTKTPIRRLQLPADISPLLRQ